MYVELVLGFSATEYEVQENDGSVMIEISFIHGIPGDYQPVILISTHNGTATGRIYKCTKKIICDYFLQKGQTLLP